MKQRASAPEIDTPRPLAPQQKRSADTKDRLLSSALRVLDRNGLEGTTVPRIAAEAKLSPASIYRRFINKDDLLRAAFLRMLKSSNLANEEHLRTKVVRETLAETAEALVVALQKQYRDQPRLVRALNRMIETEPASVFAKDVFRRFTENLERCAQVLLAHRDSIRHPDPERAARFAVLSAASVIELAALEQSSHCKMSLQLSEKAMTAELTRQMVGYLRRKP